MPVKQKAITHKFSSLSYKTTQFRALISCYLLGKASDQSIVSWHNQDKTHDKIFFIDQLRTNPRFQNLDWSMLESNWLLDDFDMTRNWPLKNFLDFRWAPYENCLINCNNETNSFRWVCDQEETYFYNNPGPYLTEKTWKTLISGCVPINTGQPGLFQWLEKNYGIASDWNVPMHYDTIIDDFDRAEELLKSLDTLVNQPLSDLVDSNLEHCERIQNMLLDKQYLESIYAFNRKQDDLIQTLCDSN